MHLASSVVVFDFETTGLSPDLGDRAIEIGAVKLVRGEVVSHFQELMNPGQRISGFIEAYTGISNNMLATAAPCAEVMNRFADFIGDSNLVAHNATFDKRFLVAELRRISRVYGGNITCSLLASRRIFQLAPDHKLGTLIDYLNIPSDGVFHRALYDSQMTAKLWMAMLHMIEREYSLQDIPFSLIEKLNKTPKKAVQKLLSQQMCVA